jgi:hypothetical protein
MKTCYILSLYVLEIFHNESSRKKEVRVRRKGERKGGREGGRI